LNKNINIKILISIYSRKAKKMELLVWVRVVSLIVCMFKLFVYIFNYIFKLLFDSYNK
jgi:hypothetical protein